jgi:hypothetical protein
VSTTALAVSSLMDARKRMEIESRYSRTVSAWQEQTDLAIRMIRAEFKMKCHLAKALRDAELREIERESDAR